MTPNKNSMSDDELLEEIKERAKDKKRDQAGTMRLVAIAKEFCIRKGFDWSKYQNAGKPVLDALFECLKRNGYMVINENVTPVPIGQEMATAGDRLKSLQRLDDAVERLAVRLEKYDVDLEEITSDIGELTESLDELRNKGETLIRERNHVKELLDMLTGNIETTDTTV